MSEITQAEVDEAIHTARQTIDGRASGFERELASAVLHLAERDRQNSAIIGLGVLAVSDAEERCAVKLAEAQAEIARLAARQMPALRWAGHEDRSYRLGNLQVGCVYTDLSRSWIWVACTSNVDQRYWSSELEARAAVEAAVRKELGVGQIETLALEPNAVVHPAGDLVAVVARLERERNDDRRRLAEAQATIAKQAECLSRHDLTPL